MRIAVCDDEKEYRELMVKYVDFYFNEKHIPFEITEFECGEALLTTNKRFDIIFLDIEMRAINGIKVAEQLSKKNKNIVIFIVTAYNSYLDDAMDLKVFRFIDKNSITAQRIYLSLDKAIVQINQGDISFETNTNSIIKLPKSDIIYIEVNKRDTIVVTNYNTYNSRKPLHFFKDQLTSDCFVVPHNSFIVNLNYVAKYQREKLTMKNGCEIFVSQKKQPEIRKLFFSYTKEE